VWILKSNIHLTVTYPSVLCLIVVAVTRTAAPEYNDYCSPMTSSCISYEIVYCILSDGALNFLICTCPSSLAYHGCNPGCLGLLQPSRPI
jgi:hypothetical protein